jgi:hypothetical protein
MYSQHVGLHSVMDYAVIKKPVSLVVSSYLSTQQRSVTSQGTCLLVFSRILDAVCNTQADCHYFCFTVLCLCS